MDQKEDNNDKMYKSLEPKFDKIHDDLESGIDAINDGVEPGVVDLTSVFTTGMMSNVVAFVFHSETTTIGDIDTPLRSENAFQQYLKANYSIDVENEHERYTNEKCIECVQKFDILIWWKLVFNFVQNSKRHHAYTNFYSGFFRLLLK